LPTAEFLTRFISSKKVTDNFHHAHRANQKQPVVRLPEWLELVRRQVGSLHYGVVEIVVHDSQVTQIETTERVRLDRPSAKSKF
jgi:hypothetical protein